MWKGLGTIRMSWKLEPGGRFKFAALFVNVKNLLLFKTMSSFVPSSKASMK